MVLACYLFGFFILLRFADDTESEDSADDFELLEGIQLHILHQLHILQCVCFQLHITNFYCFEFYNIMREIHSLRDFFISDLN